MTAPSDATPTHVFVYGTLRPGESRWHHLEPYVLDEGVADVVAGHLYDTGQGYPAALFAADDATAPTIVGRTFGLLTMSLPQALEHLDEVEGAVLGLYRRMVVTTRAGIRAWAYEYGGGLDLVPIESGDWSWR